MLTADFDYHLPPELIAQAPLPERDRSRMMVLDRAAGAIQHRGVRDLPDFLHAGDLMVVNDTRVIPARLFGQKIPTGGRVEVLLVEPRADGCWRAMCRASGRTRPGDRYRLASGRIETTVAAIADDGTVTLSIDLPDADGTVPPRGSVEVDAGEPSMATADAHLLAILDAEGATPLPPYIRRPEPTSEHDDRQRYQTVYARAPGAVAAPTAGLHLTPALIDAIERQGVRMAAVTLHVGPGTFKPVSVDRIDDHVMDAERYVVPPATARAIEQTRRNGGRILAVGSTSVRTLEQVALNHQGRVVAETGRASLFIRPEFRFQVIDMMLTNFHLPRSTLLMMISALAGRERVLAAYRAAAAERYRFYSYGDCMLIH